MSKVSQMIENKIPFDQDSIMSQFQHAVAEGNEMKAISAFINLLQFDSRYFIEINTQSLQQPCIEAQDQIESQMNPLPEGLRRLFEEQSKIDYNKLYYFKEQRIKQMNLKLEQQRQDEEEEVNNHIELKQQKDNIKLEQMRQEQLKEQKNLKEIENQLKIKSSQFTKAAQEDKNDLFVFNKLKFALNLDINQREEPQQLPSKMMNSEVDINETVKLPRNQKVQPVNPSSSFVNMNRQNTSDSNQHNFPNNKNLNGAPFMMNCNQTSNNFQMNAADGNDSTAKMASSFLYEDIKQQQSSTVANWKLKTIPKNQADMQYQGSQSQVLQGQQYIAGNSQLYQQNQFQYKQQQPQQQQPQQQQHNRQYSLQNPQQQQQQNQFQQPQPNQQRYPPQQQQNQPQYPQNQYQQNQPQLKNQQSQQQLQQSPLYQQNYQQNNANQQYNRQQSLDLTKQNFNQQSQGNFQNRGFQDLPESQFIPNGNKPSTTIQLFQQQNGNQNLAQKQNQFFSDNKPNQNEEITYPLFGRN